MERTETRTCELGTTSRIGYVHAATEDDLKAVDTRLRVQEKAMAVTQSKLGDVERTANHPEFTVGIKELRKQLQNQIALIGVLSALCLGLTISFMTVLIVEVL